jgi:Tol biopolymer transport system component
MLIVRVLSAFAKPALAGGIITAGAVGGFFAVNHFHSSSQTAFQAVQGAGPRLVISAFADQRDSIVAVDPDNVSDRTTIATVDHAAGYGIFATLAPDGKALAYTALPPNTAKPAPDAPAQAAIVDDDGTTTLLASDVDLLIAPVWAPDGQSVVVRKNTPEDNGAGTFELLRLGRDGTRTSLTTWQTAAVFPIAFAPDGSKLYFATLNADGSDLYSVAPDGSGETKVGHLSDEITRDWTLSPDGTQLAYSVAVSGNTPGLVTETLDIASGAATAAIPQSETSAQLNPAWKPGGELTVGAVKPQGGGDAVTVQSAGATAKLTQNANSMDLPLAWSPDGNELAVRSVQGKTPFDAGAAHLDLVDANGARQRVSNSADVLVVGWLR